MPQGQVQPGQRMPPDLEAPQDRAMRPESQMNAADSTKVQQQIEQGLQSQTDLSNSKIDVKADDTSVTLTGTVANENQHQKVVAIASAHAAGRSIVDHIKIQQ
jgi:osmotically-inducible protein OsmY